MKLVRGEGQLLVDAEILFRRLAVAAANGGKPDRAAWYLRQAEFWGLKAPRTTDCEGLF